MVSSKLLYSISMVTMSYKTLFNLWHLMVKSILNICHAAFYPTAMCLVLFKLSTDISHKFQANLKFTSNLNEYLRNILRRIENFFADVLQPFVCTLYTL